MDIIIPILLSLLFIYIALLLADSYDYALHHPIIRPIETFSSDGTKHIVNQDHFNSQVFFSDFADRVGSNRFLKVEVVSSTPKFLFGGIIACAVFLLYIFACQRKLINYKEHGTAQWGMVKMVKPLFHEHYMHKEISELYSIPHITLETIKLLFKSKNKTLITNLKSYYSGVRDSINSIKDKYKFSDVILTATERLCTFAIDSQLNFNVLLIGGAGTGKTRGYVLPNILQCCTSKYSPSIVVTDPKGEILSKIGKFLHDLGYAIKVLNLKEQNKSFCFNPFCYIRPEKYEEAISKLVDSIVASTNGETEAKPDDPFFDNMAKVLLKSLFFASTTAFPKREQTLNTAMQLFRMLDVPDTDDNLDCDLDLFFELFIRKYGVQHPASRNYKDFRSKCRGKTAQSVISTALTRLSPFDEKEIQRMFSKDEMELDLVGERRTALFIILPTISKSYNFIANMLYIQLFDELEYCATVKHDQRLPVPVRFILDEFYNTGRIPNFSNILSYARSFGISISIILQSLDQLKEMFEKSWATILDNCSSLIYLGGIKHHETLKYISDLLGQATFDKKSTSTTNGRQSSSSISYDKIGRALLDPAEIQKMNKHKCLFFLTGYDPFYSSKYNYKKHPNYKYTSDAHKSNKFDYTLLPHSTRESLDENPHGEDNTGLHDIRQICVNDDEQEVVKFLNDNLLHMDFDHDDLLQITDDEADDYFLYEQLADEADYDEEESQFINKLVIRQSRIEANTNLDDVAKVASTLMDSIIEKQANVDFDDIPPINDGESNDEEDFILDDSTESNDLSASFDHLLGGISDLKEDMPNFISNLNAFDTSQLEDTTAVPDNIG